MSENDKDILKKEEEKCDKKIREYNMNPGTSSYFYSSSNLKKLKKE